MVEIFTTITLIAIMNFLFGNETTVKWFFICLAAIAIVAIISLSFGDASWLQSLIEGGTEG